VFLTMSLVLHDHLWIFILLRFDSLVILKALIDFFEEFVTDGIEVFLVFRKKFLRSTVRK